MAADTGWHRSRYRAQLNTSLPTVWPDSSGFPIRWFPRSTARSVSDHAFAHTAMHLERIELLQRTPIFGGIREDMLELLLNPPAMVCVRTGGFFFHENDTADSLFVLEAGRVAVFKHWDGRQYRLRELGPGDCFGEMALMDLLPRSASVVALEDCRAIELSISALQRVCESDIEQFAMMQMNLGREVSRRLRELEERLLRAGMETSGDGADDILPL